MLARAHALVIAAAAAAVAVTHVPGRVDAEPAPAAPAIVRFPSTPATLAVTARWQPTAIDDAAMRAGLVVGYRRDDGLVLAITRAEVTNAPAWRTKTRDAYVDEIERGVAAQIDGFRRRARTVHQISEVPVLDLRATRRGGGTIVMRILLFRTYALTLAIEVPRGGDVRAATATAAGFMPRERGA